MFSSKKAARGPRSTTLVAKDTRIDGTLRSTGELDIEGHISGDIVGDEQSESTLNLLQGGRVDGEVRASQVVVNGHVSGDVYALEQLHLAPKAVVEGNVYYTSMEMELGAQVNGNLVYIANAEEESSAYASKKKIAGNNEGEESGTKGIQSDLASANI